MTAAKVTSRDLLRLLHDRHVRDVFVAECKDGPTVFGGHLRLDAWAMARSWSNPRIVGYEIKVSRSDWVGDDKWHQYLPLVNEFYVVAPKDCVAPSELPQGVGLICPTTNGARLLTLVKAAWHEHDVAASEQVMRYVLMSRATIDGHRGLPRTAAEWRQWLERKEEQREIGYNVSRALRKRYEQEVVKVRDRLARAERDTRTALEVASMFRRITGRELETWDHSATGTARLVVQLLGLDLNALQSLSRIGERINQLVEPLRKKLDELTSVEPSERAGR